MKKHRIKLADGSQTWEVPEAKQPPKIMNITPPQAERLLERALGDKNDVAQMSIKVLTPSMFVASKNFVIEKDGRVALEPFRAVLFGSDGDATVTLVVSERAVVTFDKPVGKLADLGNHNIVSTKFAGLTEMKTVSITERVDAGKPKARVDKEAAVRVGEIFVVGNRKTPTTVFLDAIRIYPGEILDYAAIRAAEKNLAEFGARVSVLEGGNSTYRDILITVKEK